MDNQQDQNKNKIAQIMKNFKENRNKTKKSRITKKK